jgi:aconitate hydratase
MANSFDALQTIQVGGKDYRLYRLDALKSAGVDLGKLPYSLKILLENLLRNEDGRTVTHEDILNLAKWEPKAIPAHEIAFRPARVLLQDFTGVPAVVDLAARRDAMKRLGGDPKLINPMQPVDLVIDHSVQVDEAGTPRSLLTNTELEYERNKERYTFLRWGRRRSRTSGWCPRRRGSSTRSTWNTWPAWSSRTPISENRPSFTRTPWSAPIPTPR